MVSTDFMRRLHLEVLKLEFNQFDVDQQTDSISMQDFALSIISYAPPMHLKKLVERAESLTPYEERVTFQQFYGTNLAPSDLFLGCV